MKHKEISSLQRIHIHVCPEHTEEKLESETLGSNPSICPSIHPTICPFTHSFIPPSIYPRNIHPHIYPPIHLFIHPPPPPPLPRPPPPLTLPTPPPTHPSIHSPIHLFHHPSVQETPIHPSIHPSKKCLLRTSGTGDTDGKQYNFVSTRDTDTNQVN